MMSRSAKMIITTAKSASMKASGANTEKKEKMPKRNWDLS